MSETFYGFCSVKTDTNTVPPDLVDGVFFSLLSTIRILNEHEEENADGESVSALGARSRDQLNARTREKMVNNFEFSVLCLCSRSM